MSAVPLGRYTPGSDEWHEFRRTHLGGSEIAAVLGLSPWVSPFSLWHLKAGLVEPWGGNTSTEWGQRLEPVIADKFCSTHPDLILRGLDGITYAHPQRDWQTATPDVLFRKPFSELSYTSRVFAKTFCEVKNSARADAWWDGPPVYYRCQVLWTMDVLGVDHAWLAVLIGGSDYREYLIELDDEAETDLAIMRDAGQRFMDSLAANQPPDLDDSYATYETVRRLTPDIDVDSEHEVSRDIAEAFCTTKAAVDDAERAYRRARSEIARHMGNANYATCEGVRIARRQPARDGGPAVLVSTRKRLPPQENAA